ncbi:MAG: transposase [Pirellulaceae bacterium]
MTFGYSGPHERSHQDRAGHFLQAVPTSDRQAEGPTSTDSNRRFAAAASADCSFRLPQTRESQFYLSTLERGERNKRALKLPSQKWLSKVVSTQRVAAMIKEFCGLDVSSG